MATFRVLVHGEGMVVRRWLLFRRTLNLYATRFIEAESREAAGARALSDLRGDPRLALATLRPPTLAVEEIEAVDAAGKPVDQPGFVFYPADSAAESTIRAT